MNITTEYELGDKVKIKPYENIEGFIDGFYYTYYGLKYYTYFYKDFNREYDYFYASELERI